VPLVQLTTDMHMEILVFFGIGFFAQLIDGALGMAFGAISTTALLSFGLSPLHASAIVHTAEVATTGASAAAHLVHKNLTRKLVVELTLAGSLGAIIGAYVLSHVDGQTIRLFVAAYLLLIGFSILLRALRAPPQCDTPPAFATPLGIIGGFLDAIGGGGWGAIVTSTLLGSGHSPRMIIGSVNIAEFAVTIAAATTFFIEIGLVPLNALLGLVAGGVLAAPFGAYVAKHVPARPLSAAVGLLVLGLAGSQMATAVQAALF
jgi:uncharacterized protein